MSTGTSRYVPIYEGERRLATENTYLGELTRTVEKGKISTSEILFEVNTDGILTVSYKDTKKDETFRQEFGMCARVISRKDINDLKEKAKIHMKDDEKETERLKAKNDLLTTCINIRYKMDMDESLQLGKAMREKGEELCETVTEWVRKNERETTDVFKKKTKELIFLWTNIIQGKSTTSDTEGKLLPFFSCYIYGKSFEICQHI